HGFDPFTSRGGEDRLLGRDGVEVPQRRLRRENRTDDEDEDRRRDDDLDQGEAAPSAPLHLSHTTASSVNTRFPPVVLTRTARIPSFSVDDASRSSSPSPSTSR